MRRYGVDVNTVRSSLKNIGTLVPPAAAILNGLGRVIHSRNDATHFNFIHNVPQRCGREVFTGSEPTSILFYRACKFTSLARGIRDLEIYEVTSSKCTLSSSAGRSSWIDLGSCD